VSYLDLAKQALARRLAESASEATPAAEPVNSDAPDEINEFTKEVRPAPTAALRTAYRRWFALTVAEADGQRIAPAEAEALHQEILKLTDEAGPAWADAVFADALRRFRSDTGRCGLCGGLGHLQEDA
jgi:hypothetical protein